MLGYCMGRTAMLKRWAVMGIGILLLGGAALAQTADACAATAAQFVSVARIGRGTIYGLTVRANGEVEARSSLGLWRYDADLATVQQVPDEADAGTEGVLSPDGTRLALRYGSGDDGRERVEVVDAMSGESLWRITAAGTVAGMLWSPDGARVAALLVDGTALVLGARR